MNLLKKSLAVEPTGATANFGHVFLRVSAGSMIFYIHGLHKLEGWIAYLQHGTPWTLCSTSLSKKPAASARLGVGFREAWDSQEFWLESYSSLCFTIPSLFSA